MRSISKKFLRLVPVLLLVTCLFSCSDSVDSDDVYISGDDQASSELTHSDESILTGSQPEEPEDEGDDTTSECVEFGNYTGECEGEEIPVRMMVEFGSILEITGWPTFEFKGEGMVAFGTITQCSEGTGEIYFDAAQLSQGAFYMLSGVMPWMEIIPGQEQLRVDVEASKMEGSIDFCTGIIHLDFQSSFQPIVEFMDPYYSMPVFYVNCVMTTETSCGYVQQRTGSRLADNGRSVAAGVSKTDATGDVWVDTLISLPTDTIEVMNMRFDFPEGRLECPNTPDPVDPKVTISIARNGNVWIGPKKFSYDGQDTKVVASIDGWDGNAAIMDFSEDTVETVITDTVPDMPDIVLSPIPFPEIALSITSKALGGTVDFTSGAVNLTFEAEYTPKIDIFGFMPVEVPGGEFELPAKFTVVTDLTTDIISGLDITGENYNEYGDGVLIGTSIVECYGIPVEVVCEIPFNIHVDRDIIPTPPTP